MAHFAKYVNSFSSSPTHYSFTLAQSFNTTYSRLNLLYLPFKERPQVVVFPSLLEAKIGIKVYTMQIKSKVF